MRDAQKSLRIEPVIITTKSALTAYIAAGVEKGLRQYKTRQEEGHQHDSFGWVDNATAMKLLNLSRPTLARYRKNGTLPYSKLGSSVYYKLGDLEALLLSRIVEGRSR